MPGKDPHRPEGKTSDAEHERRMRAREAPPEREPPAPRAPTRTPAEELRAGERPNVESRVKRVLERRDERG
jgi:hypothetical protein